MAGIDGNDGILGLQAGNRRQHPRQFLVAGHRLGAGAGRFPADIDDRGTRRNHLAPGSHRTGRRIMAAAIRKAVGGDIQDAHDPGPIHRKPGKGRARRRDQVKGGCRGITVTGHPEQLVRVHAHGGIGARLVTLHEIDLVKGCPAAGDGVAAMGDHNRPDPAGNRKGRSGQVRRPLKKRFVTHPGDAAIRQARCPVSSGGRIPGSRRACAWHAASRSRPRALRATAFRPRQ